jgi:heterodisulfide reductase subunit A|uniref:CoB--CoM heterodisulfide reductase iron-sulfur subunit A family protein n=1 Tax=Desulfobacca acetoxidans TaxID=60893 RepID=A0A7V6A1V7_9BACT
MALVRPLSRVVSSRVVVVGGGIAGLTAALDLAAVGHPVTLVEEGPSLGGLMAQLDKTFPTNDCAMCILAPRLLEAARHPLIDIQTLTQVAALEGAPGDLKVLLSRRPRYVDTAKCTGCGECARVCPKRIPDPFNLGLSLTKAIHLPFAQAVPQAAYITPEACRHVCGSKQKVCTKVCLAEAINFADQPEMHVVEAGAVILAPGARPAPVAGFPGAAHPDVVTSMEFERLLSATGPHGGKLLKPSDRQEPQSLAFIQCVGSRDKEGGAAYCSSFCCLASLKEALVARELTQGRLAATIFYMDLRAQGKEQERYLDTARAQGVELIRSRVTAVHPREDGGLVVRYTDRQGRPRERTFDMAVLAVGLRPESHLPEWAGRLGITLNEQGFIKEGQPFAPVTGREGVFVCGTGQEPMDITMAVAGASAAAQTAAQLLAIGMRPSRFGVPRKAPLPGDEHPPKIGVFLCHCGTNIARIIDPQALADMVRDLPGVDHVEDFLFSCSADATRQMANIIKGRGLNRVVVAACSPRTHEPVFREVLAAAGLNPGYLAFTNIREQCAWVHQDNPEAALAKAARLVAMAARRALELAPLAPASYPVIPRALVLGGGVAGMSAALALADQGFHTYLVERSARLGGLARNLRFTLEGLDPAQVVQELEVEVYQHPNVEVLTRAELISLSGAVGRFRSRVSQGAGEDRRDRHLQHGVVLVATGGREIRPEGSYLYGEDPRVLTQLELEEKISGRDPDLERVRRVIMVQCVGSRTPERPYCSRLCCSEALKNALLIKKRYPLVEVLVLYRDIRAFGLKELAYQEAKERGVVFLPYDPDRPPEVAASLRRPLTVRVWDELLGETVALPADMLVLSTGIEPVEGTGEVARLLKVPRATGGFFLEAHQKLKPVETMVEGIFLCGLAHYPKSLGEAVAQAQAAAIRAAALLFQEKIQQSEVSAVIESNHCRSCLTCLRSCPFGAIFVGEKGLPEIKGELCRGCGICAAECPAGAIHMSRFTDAELSAQVRAALETPRGEEHGERELLRSVR